MENVIDALLKKGITKYRLAQLCGVSWITINNWHRRIYKPSDVNAGTLLTILNDYKNKEDVVNLPRQKNPETPKNLQMLLTAGLSKYAIAKRCGVTWGTVSLWCKGAFSPDTTKTQKIEELKNEVLAKNIPKNS